MSLKRGTEAETPLSCLGFGAALARVERGPLSVSLDSFQQLGTRYGEEPIRQP
jgi:hypothetical protein